MKPDSKPDSEQKNKSHHPPEKPKAIEWEDFEQELARLCSLSSALREAHERKLVLQHKLESLIQVKTESLSRSNALDEMREKLECRKLVMQSMSLRGKAAAQDSQMIEEELGGEVRSLLVAGTAFSAARKRLQESSRSLDGQRGYLKLKSLQKMLTLRQQYMVSQVSLLYPVKISVGKAQDQELDSFPSSTRSGNSIGSKPVYHESLTIVGLQLTMLPFTKMSFFTDKKEVQRSATALGYVGHVVSLIASYLHVTLRYPLRFGGSHSYILDNTPSLDATSSDISSYEDSISVRRAEFPLFLEGQDTTRAAYAVFLLNKDLEQLLNYIGLRSLGPRYVLANLKELLRTILSADYLDT